MLTVLISSIRLCIFTSLSIINHRQLLYAATISGDARHIFSPLLSHERRVLRKDVGDAGF